MRRLLDRLFDGVEVVAVTIGCLMLVTLLSTGIAALVVWIRSL